MTKKKRAVVKRNGRPTKRTKSLDDRLCKHLADGLTLRAFCKLENTPSWKTIYNWLMKDAELSTRVAGARDLGALMIEDEILEIADTPKLVEVLVENGKKVEVVHPDDVQHRRLQIHAREKRLAWNNPAKYGTKMQVDKKVEHTIVLTDTERAVRIKQLLDKAAGKVPQIEVTVEPNEEES